MQGNEVGRKVVLSEREISETLRKEGVSTKQKLERI